MQSRNHRRALQTKKRIDFLLLLERRRNSVYRDAQGTAKKAGKQHDWNRMEILAIGNRIRHVINGQLVADWSDPKPELCQPGPIGLQLHSNKVPQEVRWRGLVLSENPEDRLITVAK